jgi:hypothetical protein
MIIESGNISLGDEEGGEDLIRCLVMAYNEVNMHIKAQVSELVTDKDKSTL